MISRLEWKPAPVKPEAGDLLEGARKVLESERFADEGVGSQLIRGRDVFRMVGPAENGDRQLF